MKRGEGETPRKPPCEELRARVAAGGPQSLQSDVAAQEHLVECDGCMSFVEAAAEVEACLGSMPLQDAPDAWVARTLERVALEAPAPAVKEGAPSAPPPWLGLARSVRSRPLVWGSLAAAVLLLLISPLLMQRARAPRVETLSAPLAYVEVEAAGSAVTDEREGEAGRRASEPEASEAVEQKAANRPARDLAVPAAPPPPSAGAPAEPRAEVDGRKREEAGGGRLAPPPAPRAKPVAEEDELEEVLKESNEILLRPKKGDARPATLTEKQAATRESGELRPGLEPSRHGSFDDDAIPIDGVDRKDFRRAPAPIAPSIGDRMTEGPDAPALAGRQDRGANAASGPFAAPGQPQQGLDAGRMAPEDREEERLGPAREFLRGRSQISHLAFASPTGYWANTYVPGDRALRLLQTRLLGDDRAAIAGLGQGRLRLHDGAYQPRQPFDPPQGAAIAAYLHADRRSLDGTQRLLVQVGLQATPRRSGRRPPMNLAVILDLRQPPSEEVAASMQALVTHLGRAREYGDRFTLFAAGAGGGLVVEPEDFRHGPLTLVLGDRLAPSSRPPGPPVDLLSVAEQALAQVSAADDPNAPLGSSVVLLVVPAPLGAALEPLADLAHRSALGGIPWSAVGVGSGAGLEELERLVLAGQGQRWTLAAPSEAPSVVERELSAASRVVARAVRLRIRLNPGVRLVDVVGSERLDSERAERVRKAEQAIDLRLARNLGIAADRGEDEEGIQIVLPSFFAGDAHVVLLDVVATESGSATPIADLTVRYKDLVHPGNRVARARLSLPREGGAAGPLERNVLKNFLAARMRSDLERAAERVQDGDLAAAAGVVRELEELLTGLRSLVAGLSKDPELGADLVLLREYATLLESGVGGAPSSRDYLRDSLRYSGWLKVLPRPGSDGGL